MRTLILLFLALCCLSCDESRQRKTPEEMPSKEERMESNKLLMQRENNRIDGYIARREWPVKRSETGLRYWVYDTTDGTPAASDMVAHVSFTVSLLNGTVCYTADSANPEQFLIDMDYVESGLHEGIRYMKVGEKAKLVLPPHLAHGLVGDRNKIPMHATIIYDIHLHKLTQP